MHPTLTFRKQNIFILMHTHHRCLFFTGIWLKGENKSIRQPNATKPFWISRFQAVWNIFNAWNPNIYSQIIHFQYNIFLWGIPHFLSLNDTISLTPKAQRTLVLQHRLQCSAAIDDADVSIPAHLLPVQLKVQMANRGTLGCLRLCQKRFKVGC